MISLDIFATAVHYAGATPRNPLDGVNLLPFLTGEKQGLPHDYLFWRKFDAGAYAIRSGDLKWVNEKGEKDEVFNLSSDIGERAPLGMGAPYDRLIQQYRTWSARMIDPVFLGLSQNEAYNQLHPDRFEGVEAY